MKTLTLLLILLLSGCTQLGLPDPTEKTSFTTNQVLTKCHKHRPEGFWELDYGITTHRFILEVFNNVEAKWHAVFNKKLYSQYINFRIPVMNDCTGIWKIQDTPYILELETIDSGTLRIEGDTLLIILTRINGLNIGDGYQQQLSPY